MCVTKKRLKQIVKDKRNMSSNAVELRMVAEKALKMWNKVDSVHRTLDRFMDKHC